MGKLINVSDWEAVKEEYKLWWKNKQKKPLFSIAVPKRKDLSWTGWEIAHWIEDNKVEEKYISCAAIIKKRENDIFNMIYKGVAFPSLWFNLGPGVVAAYLTEYLKVDIETVWFELHEPMAWEKILSLKVNPDNKWWKVSKNIINEMAALSQDKFVVGNTDLGGNLDILASLRGAQTLLYDIIDSPHEVKQSTKLLTDHWFKFYEELYCPYEKKTGNSSGWMGLWAPSKSYQLQCDFGAMLSPEMFEEFAMPDLRRQAEWLDYAVFHLDGPGMIPHLDKLLDVKNITAIQWVPGSGKPVGTDEMWIPLYKKIQDKGKGIILVGAEPKKLKDLFKKISPSNVYIPISLSTEAEADEYLKFAETFK